MTILDIATPGLCGCGRVASERHRCEHHPDVLRVSDANGNPIWCPCCGSDDWCPQEWVRAYAEAMAAPELVIGSALYRGEWA